LFILKSNLLIGGKERQQCSNMATVAIGYLTCFDNLYDTVIAIAYCSSFQYKYGSLDVSWCPQKANYSGFWELGRPIHCCRFRSCYRCKLPLLFPV